MRSAGASARSYRETAQCPPHRAPPLHRAQHLRKTMLLLVSSAYCGALQAPLLSSSRQPTVLSTVSRLRMAVAAPDYGAEVPYGEAAYDPAAAKEFFEARPMAVAQRSLELLRLSGSFLAATLLDQRLGRAEEMVEQRSQELVDLVAQLGPTFIKVGQALSIRTDLLPAPYAAGLTQLQDAVPPFPGAEGRAVIEAELGISLDTTFSQISSEPVASASIGQVYKATLRTTGEEVAVKVQRPRVLTNVALDLYMLREVLVPLYQRVNKEQARSVETVSRPLATELHACEWHARAADA